MLVGSWQRRRSLGIGGCCSAPPPANSTGQEVFKLQWRRDSPLRKRRLLVCEEERRGTRSKACFSAVIYICISVNYEKKIVTYWSGREAPWVVTHTGVALHAYAFFLCGGKFIHYYVRASMRKHRKKSFLHGRIYSFHHWSISAVLSYLR